MNIPESVVLSLQENLYLTSLAGYSADLFIGLATPPDLKEQHRRWQQAVNEIGRCMLSGLLEIEGGGWLEAVGLDDVNEFLRALAQNSPYDEKNYEVVRVRYWFDPLLCSTPLCRDLFARHFADEDALEFSCPDFVRELEHLFAIHGLEWKDTPLVPISK